MVEAERKQEAARLAAMTPEERADAEKKQLEKAEHEKKKAKHLKVLAKSGGMHSAYRKKSGGGKGKKRKGRMLKVKGKSSRSLHRLPDAAQPTE